MLDLNTSSARIFKQSSFLDNPDAGIENDWERTILFSMDLLILLISLFGDSIILIVTIRYKAIKLQRVIVAVIQHLAVCDLMQAVFRVFPITLAVKADRWVLGKWLCKIEFNMQWFGLAMTFSLTGLMATLQLLTEKNPLKTNSWPAKFGHKLCAAVWCLCLGLYSPVLVSVLLYFDIQFNRLSYTCLGSESTPNWFVGWAYLQFYLTVFTFWIIPFIFIVVSSVLLLIIAKSTASRQHGETVRREGFITVLLTVAVLLISTLPATLMIGFHQDINPSISRAVIHLQFFNVMSNFFVYILVITSFRKFLKLKISQLSFLLKSCESPRHEKGDDT